MRTATDDKGDLLFSEADWLQPSQIKNMFSGLAKKKKLPGQKRLFSETDDAPGMMANMEDEEDEEDLEHDDDDDTPHDMMLEILQNTTDMNHPVIYQNINLCEIRKSGSIKRYGEKKLRNMIESLNLNPIDMTKTAMVECLGRFLDSCPCGKN